MKKCETCGRDKDPAQFYRDIRTQDRLEPECMDCSDEKGRANMALYQKYERKRGRAKSSVLDKPPEFWARHTEYTRKWRSKNPEKYAAHTALNNAVRDGKVIKGECAVCGSAQVEAHHDDYSKPLEVRWLCVAHHGETRRLDLSPQEPHPQRAEMTLPKM